MIGSEKTGSFLQHEWYCKSKQIAGQCPFRWVGRNMEPQIAYRCITYDDDLSGETNWMNPL
jgi:hypothetical protein